MDSQAYQDSIHSQLSGMFGTGTTEGTATGGSFAYTEADISKIRDNWLDLADSYQTSMYNADRMSKIKSPAEDMASTFHVTAANRSGQSYTNYLKHNRDYCLQQAQLFQNALDDYLGVEHINVAVINNAGGQPGPQAGM
ncbi:hypothetical protein [Actinophytocola algeriensis]|uniref:PE domain-containing protein n=1 Tax=Actinophytocola algeriensis TaxID=1768010 RepID=A0A7W7Q252_9PSEU|nr:hypothetical protein [Actinophytocola algeriensis]MBB4905411.1 hypothetical protein [Actinophytocola algeriensis]MBE1472904.1 hypothetical protein [Actinophytocola algeriensis]